MKQSAIAVYNSGGSVPFDIYDCDRASQDGNRVVTFFKGLRIVGVVRLEPGQTTRFI
jgi:hypothetical protein